MKHTRKIGPYVLTPVDGTIHENGVDQESVTLEDGTHVGTLNAPGVVGDDGKWFAFDYSGCDIGSFSTDGRACDAMMDVYDERQRELTALRAEAYP
jgi:hypothetical protein